MQPNDLAPRPAWLAALHDRVLAIEVLTLDLQPSVEAIAVALRDARFAPERLSVAILTQHPGLSGLAYVWRRVEGRVDFFERPWGFLDSDEHRESPLHHVLTTRAPLFLDADAIAVDGRFPLVQSFVAAGATSYLALPLFAARGDTHVFALWTARPGGWSSAEAREIGAVVPLLALLVEVTENRRLLGMIGAAHEVTQRALAEQALRNADALVQQQAADMARLEAERNARLETERQLEQRSRDLAQRNEELKALAASLEDKVSERTRELELALARANAATVAKSRFLATMSHEIRTPMHGVLGLGELLSRTDLDDEQARYVDTLQGTGKALLSLLNDILDFSKIEADRLELETIALDPSRLLEEVVTLMRPTAEGKGITVEYECAPDVPLTVEGDPTRLRQLWVNLVGNAVKFTDEGRVSVRLEVASRSEGRLRLRSVVTDTGTGISPEALDRLFEPFAQGDGSTTRRFGGTGLGLAICKKLIDQMGGGITVDSRVGVGSTFAFEIPVRPRLAAAVPPPAASSSDFAELSVLVVDDNPVNRMITERQLKVLGTRTPVLVPGGAEALDALNGAPFDVVFMDMQMPDMDGLEATRRLRGMTLPRQPLIIAMTANAFEEDRRACAEVGMNGFLPKPVSIDALRDVLRGVAASVRSGSGAPLAMLAP